MRRKFRSLFKEEFVGEGLKFKGALGGSGHGPAAGNQVRRRWLTLGWNMSGSDPPAAE